MSAPDWLRWTLAAVMIAVAGYHLARFVLVRRQVDVELAHAAMAAAMVPMLLSASSHHHRGGLALVFVVAAAWFGARAVRRYVLYGPSGVGLLAAPMVGFGAMAYLLADPSRTASMSGMSGSSPAPALLGSVLVIAVAGLATSSVRDAAFAGGAARAPSPEVVGGPALALGCGLAVNLTTVFMLVAM